MLGCIKESEKSKIAVINFTYKKTHTHRYTYTHIKSHTYKQMEILQKDSIVLTTAYLFATFSALLYEDISKGNL